MASVLIVASGEEDRRFLQSALEGHQLWFASTAEEALSSAKVEAPQILLADFRTIGAESDLFRTAAERHPRVHRLLWAQHDDLPTILQTRQSKLVARILPKPGKAWNLQKAVNELFADRATAGDAHPGSWEEAHELIRGTALRAVRIPGSVLRSLPPEAAHLQMEFVIVRDAKFEQFRAASFESWGEPIRRRGWNPWGDAHPVERLFGRVGRKQDVFVRAVGDGASHVYLALLPWARRGESRLTILLGIQTPEEPAPHRAALESVHTEVTQQLSQFFVPALAEEASRIPAAQYLPEYDWVVTRSYVGADRRRAPTSFANPHVMLGRRKYVPRALAALADVFVDRFAPWVLACFAAYLVLAVADSILTWHYVRSGAAIELNPLIRPLLEGSPWLFFLAKNAAAIAVFLVIARFQFFRIGRWFVYATVAAYALLDAYWIWLLTASS